MCREIQVEQICYAADSALLGVALRCKPCHRPATEVVTGLARTQSGQALGIINTVRSHLLLRKYWTVARTSSPAELASSVRAGFGPRVVLRDGREGSWSAAISCYLVFRDSLRRTCAYCNLVLTLCARNSCSTAVASWKRPHSVRNGLASNPHELLHAGQDKIAFCSPVHIRSSAIACVLPQRYFRKPRDADTKARDGETRDSPSGNTRECYGAALEWLCS